MVLLVSTDREFFRRLREAYIAELLYDLEIEFPELVVSASVTAASLPESRDQMLLLLLPLGRLGAE